MEKHNWFGTISNLLLNLYKNLSIEDVRCSKSIIVPRGGQVALGASPWSIHPPVLWSFLRQRQSDWSLSDLLNKNLPRLNNYTTTMSSLSHQKKAPASGLTIHTTLSGGTVMFSACALVLWLVSSVPLCYHGRGWHFVSLHMSHSCLLSTTLINISLIGAVQLTTGANNPPPGYNVSRCVPHISWCHQINLSNYKDHWNCENQRDWGQKRFCFCLF